MLQKVEQFQKFLKFPHLYLPQRFFGKTVVVGQNIFFDLPRRFFQKTVVVDKYHDGFSQKPS